ncbi:MAG TPA: ABC transporter permease [Candidatus Polarisedimenticolia bacterium]|nr:ABC transporter permease [Candidatus Polarisedimenticolia bacterium]
MRRIGVIALNTFREAIRDRILYLLLVFALLLMVSAQLLSLLTVGGEEKIIKDLGLASISLFGVLTAVFIGVSLVSKEIERRTIYTIVSKPIHRHEFLLGKFCGLALTLGVNTAIMTAFFYLLLLLKGFADPRLLLAIVLIYMELLLVTAFATLFSAFSTPILSTLFSLSLYLVGHLTWSLDLLSARLAAPSGKVLCRILFLALPNLEIFNIKGDVVHGAPIPLSLPLLALAYLLGYGGAVLAAACWILDRRDFN